MPDVVKHAWTHRPRAQGGTDPIEVGGSLKWAQASYGQEDHVIGGGGGGVIRIRWNTLDTNDTSVFSLTDVSADTIQGGAAEWAEWLAVSEAGLYQVFSRIDHPVSEFASGQTVIRPVFNDGFGDAALEQLTTYDWNTGNGLTLGSEYNTGTGWDHSGLWCVNMIWHDPALDSASPLEMGLQISTAISGTFTVGGAMFVVQLTSGVSPTVSRQFL